MVIFENCVYFYAWESNSAILRVYDSNRCEMGTIEIAGFDREPEALKELVVLVFIEAIVKKKKAEKLLDGLF